MANGTEPSKSQREAGERLVTFLHLSDLHVGMATTGWLWPTIKAAFYADLRRLLPVSGFPDIVVFSGDLVQRASPEEYERLSGILGEMWKLFRELGCNPLFVPVPGNHDLTRQPAGDLAARALKEWWTDAAVPKAFWAGTKGYSQFLADSFENYLRFLESLEKVQVPVARDATMGLIPGDISIRVPVGEHFVGVIGLNSAWLQVSEGDYKGRLDVDPRQLMAITENEPELWCQKNAVNLLVTHHPESWLHSDSQATWQSEINCGTRFDCHLYGHMHEQQSSVVSSGGYEGQRLLQGASLFGLEWVTDRQVKRIHGYSVNQITSFPRGRTLRQWPREAMVGANGAWKLVPNLRYNLERDGEYYDVDYSADAAFQPAAAPMTSIAIKGDKKVLDALRRVLPVSEPARHIRKIDQQICLEAITNRRMLWLVADWGLGADEFLEAMIGRLNLIKPPVFQVDVGQYADRDAMLDGIHRDLGASFQQVCEAISQQPGCVLIFDDIDVATENGSATMPFLDALGDIGNAVLQYCSNVHLVFRSRRRPAHTSLDVIELTTLNELDAMLYIQNHPMGGIEIATESLVRKIVGHTDGLPSRIDEALRDIEVLGIDGLHLVNADVSGRSANLQPPPPGLAETISKLAADDPASPRAFHLLSVLSLFPRGEYFESVRRFDNAHPFYPQDGRRLIDLGLVDTSEIPNIGSATARLNAKSLVVKRPVREYLIGYLPTKTVEKLNRHALELYFGDKWSSGAIKPPKGTRFDERTCESWKIDNATLLIMREAKDAIEAGTHARIANAANLANSYCSSLYNGEHYDSLIRAATDFLAMYRDLDGHEVRRTNIELLLGRALRMSGDHQECINVLTRVVGENVSNDAKSIALLSLALASESLDLDADALTYAKQCIEINKVSRDALHARSVIVGIESEGHPKRKEKLLKLAREAEKSGATTIASNVRLQCMHEERDDDEKLALARRVLEDSKVRGDDHYNAMRAMLCICKITVSAGKPLSDLDLDRVIDAYHYLVNESMDSLFGLAHGVLWGHFALAGDVVNLLSLFRHSSFKWQLRGKGSLDHKYATEVIRLLGGLTPGGSLRSSRETTYLFLRSGQGLKKLE